MAQPVTAIILSRQGELAAKARQFTEGANEASLLVGRVISRALSTFRDDGADDEVIIHSMRRDLDRLIEQLRKAKL
jgi:predicted GNAT family N-acyltransferase